MLKVVSILMIIFGIIAAIFNALVAAGAGFFAAAGGAGMASGELDSVGTAVASEMASKGTFVLVQCIIGLIGSIVEIIGGFKGLGAVKDPSKAPSCVKFGIICAVLAIVSIVITVAFIGFNASSVITSVVLSLLIPVLYILGLKNVSGASSSN